MAITTPPTDSASSGAQGAAKLIKERLPLTRLNFILMGAAILVIVVGFLLMTGEPSGADTFNPDIFSTRRIVVGPTVTFLGYIFMGAAIMWPSRRRGTNAGNDSPNEASEA